MQAYERRKKQLPNEVGEEKRSVKGNNSIGRRHGESVGCRWWNQVMRERDIRKRAMEREELFGGLV